MQPTRPFVFAALTALLAIAAHGQTQKAPLGNPCQLLTDAEVRTVFPNAKAGRLDRKRQEYGLVDCVWDHSGGNLGIQLSALPSGSKSIKDEMEGYSLGFLDPLRPAAKHTVRYETLKNVGDRAMAVIERADPQRGILSDTAMLIAQRGERQILLLSNELAKGDRATALKAFEELGRIAANRL